jgi:Divergent InlB B-repeat domain
MRGRVEIVIILLCGLATQAARAQTLQLRMAWTDNASNEGGFQIERRVGTTGPFAPLDTLPADTTNYIDTTGLVADTTYCYRVVAFAGAEFSPYSNEICGTVTLASALPTPSSGLTVSGSGAGRVTLTATPNPGFRFSGWSGSCSGTGPCTVPLSEVHQVQALFTPETLARFLRRDTTTKGNWRSVYGAEGFILLNHQGTGQDVKSLPAHLNSYSHTGAHYVWNKSTADPRALVNLSGTRVAATAYSNTTFTLSLSARDLSSHLLALYFLDWDGTQRAQTVTISDATTNVILDERPLSNFNGGFYYVYEVQGSVRVELRRTAGANAVLSGVFWGS